jgi:hypothetical protein
MTTTPRYSDLSNTLWQERQLLEMLVFKLEEEQLLLASGRNRWLGHATREVEAVLERLKRHELERAIQADAAGAHLRLDRGGVTLRELAAKSPPPWDQLLSSHHDALSGLVREVNALARSNRDLLASGQHAMTEAIDRLQGPSADGYSPQGRERETVNLGVVDRVI